MLERTDSTDTDWPGVRAIGRIPTAGAPPWRAFDRNCCLLGACTDNRRIHMLNANTHINTHECISVCVCEKMCLLHYMCSCIVVPLRHSDSRRCDARKPQSSANSH
uniref:Uncharacterized protein n=1 Tax=Bactrocera dorsalis TaxID=27457 RepID=A0A034WP90_BACDO